ncbi:Uncharacterised protein [uncultured archaeon]|nr:Uncharacterised protein [uncultured archaeon]
MAFERNYYKPHATCPKCGSLDPKPKYVPQDAKRYYDAMTNWHHLKHDIARIEATMGPVDWVGELPPEPSTDLIKPDRVDCLCICGWQWSENGTV